MLCGNQCYHLFNKDLDCAVMVATIMATATTSVMFSASAIVGCRRKYLCSKTIVLILRLLSFMHKKSSGDSRNFWNCFWGLR